MVVLFIVAFGFGRGLRITADWFLATWAPTSKPKHSLRHPTCALHHSVLDKELLEGLLVALMDFSTMYRRLGTYSTALCGIWKLLTAGLFLDSVEMRWVVAGALIICALASPIFAIAYASTVIVFYSAAEYFKMTSRELKRLEDISRLPIFPPPRRIIYAYGILDAFNTRYHSAVDANAEVLFATVGASRWLSLRMEFL
ncbi:hypothetical protein ACHHYP_20008 [Achlya hypogyna]|uniref:Uncharacterized protein n=1 Tax=Achlya hypogyna TaxID=1202772 RepID=A0A1V9ZB46_ACHHY|nr:hypothetical protein ACHHYP_20008 [Achlya hypogyna]